VSKRLTTTSYALLGLLALRSWTTYELAKQVQRGLGWFWPRAERKLYEEPKRLVDAGFATATEEYTGNRARTVYTITRTGRKALRGWLDEPSAPPTLEFEALVKVFFADGGSLEQLQTTLQAVEDEASARIAELRTMIEQGRESSYEFAVRRSINALALRFQLDHEALLVRWAAWARAQTSTWRSPTDSADWDWYAALTD
jgi:PadR family transcriptional regulator, regulatory protein AphA